MKTSDYVARFLAAQGIPQVFEVVGGMITHLLDSMHVNNAPRVVSVHHEQAAAFAAEGYARMTGIPGVALATSGPGATNLLTGIGSCFFDSTPALFLTGQVNRSEQKRDKAIRQLGFQETDITSIAAPITKASILIDDADQVPAIFERAVLTALSGRPGPVLLDIPMDVQRVDIQPQRIESVRPPAGVEPDEALVREALDALRRAERPLILVGGGIRSGRAAGALRILLEDVQIPVVNSLMAVDVLPFAHPQRAGLIGSYGNRWANLAIARSDVMLVLGSRLDVRQTGADTDGFRAGRRIFHVDCEPGEMNNRVTGCTAIESELQPFLLAMARRASAHGIVASEEWTREIASLRAQWPDTAESPELKGINPNVFLHQLSRAAQSAAAYVADVGQHQMWAAQSLELGPEQRFLTSGGMGAMGFGLPAAIGACFAVPGQPVVLIAGDGGFQLNIQELETVRRNGLPLKMILINNGCHGMVRQFQQSYFHERYQSTLWGYSAPDFARVAGAYDIPAKTVERDSEIDGALSWMSASDGPALLQVMIDTYTNAYPKLAFGRPITEMEPLATPLEMEGT
ncbi:MAG: acetolactate synthase large subunit [Thermoanaerobaculia bacterium]|jgi:acetolactate synthase-1/2/3 large subunit|nr:acetolactate synthase large subunit [Thermoanaerobaculia bacterium]